MRLQEDRAKREERAFQKVQEERVLQEVQEERALQAKLQEVREERVLQASLQEWQEKLEQKQKEHVDMCRKVQEVRAGRLCCVIVTLKCVWELYNICFFCRCSDSWRRCPVFNR